MMQMISGVLSFTVEKENPDMADTQITGCMI